MKKTLQVVLLLLFPLAVALAQAQEVTVSGKVIDEKNEALPGANVIVKGTTIGTVTDVDGNYTLTVPSNAETLTFSFVGYLTEESPINAQSVINMTLYLDVLSLSEVVVVGYGEKRKADLIGAVSQLDAKSIKELPITTFDQALTGQVAGVQTRQTGRPGGGPEVLIRGVSSIGANNAPLYVIDGFPVGNSNEQKDNFNLSWLSPDDIESISVLKDAAAKAIYGSRASAGVVIITTKKGKQGAPSISFSTYTGIQEIPDYEKLDVLNARQLAQFQRERIEDQIRVVQGREPTEEDIPEAFRNPEQYGEGTDWFDEATRNGIMQNYHINMNGGTDKVTYNVSAGYFNQEGVVLTTQFERYSVRAKFDAKISDRLRYGMNIAPSWVRNQASNTDPNEESGFGVYGAVLSSYWVDPSASVNNPDGTLSNNTQGDLLEFFTASPVFRLKETRDNRETSTLLFGNYLELDILKNLTAKTFFSVNNSDRRVDNFTPSTLPGTSLPPNPEGTGIAEAQIIHEVRRNWINENTLTYRAQLNDVHKIDALAGFILEKREFQKTNVEARNLIEEGFIRPITPNNVASDNVNNLKGTESFEENALVSFLGRVNYVYDNKYFVTAALRRDGSSRFGADQRFGNFPSLTAAWRISNEGFWNGSLKNIISDLKLEAGYGLSGNNAIGNYIAQGRVGTINYVFGQVPGANPAVGPVEAPGSVVNRVPNSILTWEETEQWDVGLDIGLLTNRINISLDVYNAVSKDFLISAPVPRSTGFADIISNAGSIRNRGFEIELGTSGLVKAGDFTYDVNVNFTRNVNEVIELTNEELNRGGAGNGTTFSTTREGEPVGLFRGLLITGLFTQAEIDDPDVPKYNGAVEGSINYVDADGDGRLEELEDYVVIGNPHPDFVFGLRHNFKYRNFDLSILMNGAIGQQIFDLSKQNLQNLDGVFNLHTSVLDRFRPGDDPTTKTIPGTVQISGSSVATQRWRIPNSASVQDADYLMVRNITLGYNIPNGIFDQKFFKNARAYVSVQNAILFTEYELGNPEVGRAGDNALVRNVFQGSYPNVRTYTLGLNVTF
ncbi:TonB-dependent receptor [Fulvivirga sp. M361]|uniref:SusC/RagA family TonB-linked outer membrane protein n=1 Tax=Fulvivirga sp. M361 TaxID=2594266 RepID=UPI00117B7063|nr:TonB-dependent receptor [Fulvivirga sp. M361]TRX60007.1 TonB-dependent receptor [Fulvivirga sp. M361]